jgi:hypothetical protein
MTHPFIVFFEALFFIYSAYLAGSLFTSFKSPAYSVICGYGIYIVAGFALALCGQFSAWPLWILTVIVWAVSWKRIRLPASLHESLREHMVPKLIIAAWLIANFFLVFVPITGYDTLDYHLPMMLDIVREKRMTYSPDIRQYQSLPVFGEILYTVPMSMFGEATPDLYRIFGFNNTTEITERKIVLLDKGPFVFQVVQYSVIVLLAFLLYEFLRKRVKNGFLASAAVLCMLSIFDLWREILHGGYIDVFAFLFGLASIFILIESCCDEIPDRRELWLSAFFLGVSLGIKYIALFFAFADGLLLIVFFAKHRIAFKQALTVILKYAAIIILVAGFWYAKNFIHFGNPVYPMFSVGHFDSVVNEFIMKPNIVSLPAFPFYRYGGYFVDPKESSSRLVVFGYYALAYLLAALLLITRRKFSLFDKLLALSTIAVTALLFFSSHIYRFLIPSVILLVPLVAILVDKFFIYIEEKGSARLYYFFGKISVAAVYAALLAIFLLGNFHFWKARFDYVLGKVTVEEYMKNIGSL